MTPISGSMRAQEAQSGLYSPWRSRMTKELNEFRDPAGVMWVNHEGECWSQGVNLAEWLTGTLTGTLTVETLLESQPTS
ncbi:hypothetical protein J3S85_27850 [Streptomyces lavenduligriseus]|nr:hypothetical protein J3S85_27850 [Streptomyces lavenduligriseus]